LLWLFIAELTKPEKPEKFLLSQDGKILIFSKNALLSRERESGRFGALKSDQFFYCIL
jgi:hypothetical protein